MEQTIVDHPVLPSASTGFSLPDILNALFNVKVSTLGVSKALLGKFLPPFFPQK